MKKIAIFVVVVLAGCASTENIKPVQAPSQLIHFPAINVDAEAEIGETIVSKANLTVHAAVTVNQEIKDYIKQSAANNRFSGTTTIRAGTHRKTSENSLGSFFPDPLGTFQFTGGTKNCVCGIFVPNDTTKPAVVFTYHSAAGASGFEYGVAPVVVTKTTSEEWKKDSLKKELIYGGLSHKTITVSYREFSDGTARPAFTQDLKYDLTESDIIGFRGARFQVQKATNTVIKYKVIKSLD